MGGGGGDPVLADVGDFAFRDLPALLDRSHAVAAYEASVLAKRLAWSQAVRWRDRPQAVHAAVSALIAALASAVPGREGIYWAIVTPGADLPGAVASLRDAVLAAEDAFAPQ